MKITIPEIPPSLNKYAGRMNGWEYRAEKQRWIGLMRAYCKKQKPMDKAIVTITYYFPTRHRHDPDNYNGKMLMDGLTDRGVIASEEEEKSAKKKMKTGITIFIIGIVLFLIVPSSETVMKMIIAKNVTYDAVDAAKDVVVQVYNDILALFQK